MDSKRKAVSQPTVEMNRTTTYLMILPQGRLCNGRKRITGRRCSRMLTAIPIPLHLHWERSSAHWTLAIHDTPVQKEERATSENDCKSDDLRKRGSLLSFPPENSVMGVLMTKVGRKNWNEEVSGNCGDPASSLLTAYLNNLNGYAAAILFNR